MMIRCPRLIVAGLGGDTGKTVISVGLCRTWQKKGLKVIPFKKGPDYIDMGWLSLGASHPCYNLDLFLMSKDQTLSSFGIHTQHSDIALIEGNRGLYDGLDIEGSVSTSELAKLLKSPVVIIVDCTKVTRTVAALVLGCQRFDSDVPIQGVILNRLASSRQETVIRESTERYCHLPVVGAIPRLANVTFPGRHLGLVPPQEHPRSQEAIEKAAETVGKYLDLVELWQIANKAPPIKISSSAIADIRQGGKGSRLQIPTHPSLIPPLVRGDTEGLKGCEGKLRIGLIRDSAFQFYYPENIESLERAGAEIIEFSALTDDLPPSIHALYIGGGFPETHASALSANKRLKQSIKKAAKDGLPIYAECGGLMYLGEKLIWEGNEYPMVGVFPVVIGVSRKPQGHGYSILEVDAHNPFFKIGQVLRGHEFHYSHILNIDEILRLTEDNENNPPLPPFTAPWKKDNPPFPPLLKGGEGGLFSKGGFKMDFKGGKRGFEKMRQGGFSEQKDSVYFAFRMKMGAGILDGMDGLCFNNVLATYTHLHALGSREWVEGIMNMAIAYKEHRL